MHLVLNTYGCFIRENVLKSEYRTMRGRLRKKQLKLAEDVKGAELARDWIVQKIENQAELRIETKMKKCLTG